MPRRRTRPGRLRLPAVAFLLAAGCASGAPREGMEDIPKEPYRPPPERPEPTTGQLIQECERHLREWQALMAAQRSAENREALIAVQRSLARLVRPEQARLEEQAISGPPRNRAVASAALPFTGDPQVLPLLLNNAADPEPMIRANALLGLGILARADTPLRPIRDAATDPDATQEVLRNAAYAGFRIAEVARADADGNLSSTFASLLGNPDATVRAQAAAGLGLIRASHMVPPLQDLLLGDADAQVRTASAFALGEIGAPGSAPGLVRALEDKDRITAGAARGALAKIVGRDLGPRPADWEGALGLRPR